ncbi:MAG TPA: hypothetical protein DHN29_12950 [Cytophagales bacterium]|nr:hypothetical protein [Cytophagales bacterium]|tara:strand:- start:2198 stop:2554 length:357 start_codon:yes stop_codon:yes gene_type:complete
MSGASEKAGLSDILANDEVFLLARNRKRMSLITFFDEAKEKGLKESKRVGKRRIPGVVITEPGRGGFFFMFHSEDMMEIAEVLINVRAGNGSTYSRARFISKLRELADSIEREGEEDE